MKLLQNIFAILVLGSAAQAEVKMVFPLRTGESNTVLIKGDSGEELNRILAKVPPHILVGISGVSTATRPESGDPSDQDKPFYWISGAEGHVGINVDEDKIAAGPFSIGTTSKGQIFITGFDIMGGTTLPQAIHRGLQSTRSSLVSCRNDVTSPNSPFPGFSYTTCLFKK